MTPQQFRLLVIVNQLLLFGGLFVGDLTDHLLPPELQSYPSADTSVLGGDPLETVLAWRWHLINIGTLAGAIGLCLGHRWGRTLYLVSFLLAALNGLTTPFGITTSWEGLVLGLYGTTEGMILALAYFSHLKRMFEDTQEDSAEDESEDEDEEDGEDEQPDGKA